MSNLLPEEQAFIDAFWGTGWTVPQAQKALANLLEWKRKQVLAECEVERRTWLESMVSRLQAERNRRVESTALGRLSEELEEDNLGSAATIVRSAMHRLEDMRALLREAYEFDIESACADPTWRDRVDAVLRHGEDSR